MRQDRNTPRPRARAGALPALCLLAAAQWAAGSASSAEFRRTGDLLQGRDWGLAAPLPDGRVLITGGVGLDDNGWGTYLAASELYDPAAGSFSATGALHHGRDGNATITPLADGRVLVAGGVSRDASGNEAGMADGEVYDSGTGRFTPTANRMSSPRYFHTATRLADGRVLLAGGWGQGRRLASADIYDPDSNRFTRVGDMRIERNSHSATLLPDGKVLIAGGLSTDAELVSSTELFDPVTGRFSDTDALAGRRMMATASTLEDGRALVVGGMDYAAWQDAAELYDSGAAKFSSGAALRWPRSSHGHTPLPDGRVLISGGDGEESGWRSERYDPAKARFEQVANMAVGRTRPAAAVLPGGEVLVAGGARPWEPPVSYAEVYVPTRMPGPYSDLSLDLTATAPELPAGSAFAYVLQLRNLGEVAAKDARIVAELPPGLRIRKVQVLDSRRSGPWNCSREGSSLSCGPVGGTPLAPDRAGDGNRPAVAIVVQAQAPRTADVLLAAFATAATGSAEDVTGNNEAVSLAYVYRDGTAGAQSRAQRAQRWREPGVNGLHRARPDTGLARP